MPRKTRSSSSRSSSSSSGSSSSSRSSSKSHSSEKKDSKQQEKKKVSEPKPKEPVTQTKEKESKQEKQIPKRDKSKSESHSDSSSSSSSSSRSSSESGSSSSSRSRSSSVRRNRNRRRGSRYGNRRPYRRFKSRERPKRPIRERSRRSRSKSKKRNRSDSRKHAEKKMSETPKALEKKNREQKTTADSRDNKMKKENQTEDNKRRMSAETKDRNRKGRDERHQKDEFNKDEKSTRKERNREESKRDKSIDRSGRTETKNQKTQDEADKSDKNKQYRREERRINADRKSYERKERRERRESRSASKEKGREAEENPEKQTKGREFEKKIRNFESSSKLRGWDDEDNYDATNIRLKKIKKSTKRAALNEMRDERPEKEKIGSDRENGSERKGWFEKPDERQKLRVESKKSDRDPNFEKDKGRDSDRPAEIERNNSKDDKITGSDLKIRKKISDETRNIKDRVIKKINKSNHDESERVLRPQSPTTKEFKSKDSPDYSSRADDGRPAANSATSLSSSFLEYIKPDITSKLKLLKCQNHADRTAQFINRSSQNGKFLCEECGPKEDIDFLVNASCKNYRGDYIKVEQLLDYINEEYTKLKRKSVSIGLPIPRFEEFLSSRDALISSISKALTENQDVIINRLETLRLEFNKMIDLHKSFVSSMYSKEIKQFETNAKFLSTKIEGFLKELQKLSSLPTLQEITSEFKQAKYESNLQEAISSHLSQIESASKTLVSRSADGIFKKQQKVSAMLAYLKDQSRDHPKIYHNLQYVTRISEDPLGCIMEYLQMCQKQLINTNPFKMLSSYSDLETDATEYQFERNIQNLSSDYFSKTIPSNLCCLHYFDNLHKKLVIVNIDGFSDEVESKAEGLKEYTRGFNYEEIDLSGERRFAPLAKSIPTPKGEIYVVGGLRSKAVFHLLPRSQPVAVSQKAELPYDKYGMGLLYVEPCIIYSIGGITSRNSRLVPTGQCERYIISEDKWEQIPSLTLPASQPGLCLYANRYIYKFGGYITEDGRPNNLIEEFDMYVEKWKELRVTDFNGAQMLPKSIGLQINDDQVVLLGGSSYFSSTGSYFALNLRNRWNVHSHDDYHQDYSDLIQPLEDISSLEGYEIVAQAVHNQKFYVLAVFQKSESLAKKLLVFDRNFFQIERT